MTDGSKDEPLLQTCRQIRREALPISWRKRVFRFNGIENFIRWSLAVEPHQQQHVRHIDLNWGLSFLYLDQNGWTDCSWYMIQGVVPFPLNGELAFDKSLEFAEKWESRYVELCNLRRDLINRISPAAVGVLQQPPPGRLTGFRTETVLPQTSGSCSTESQIMPSVIQLLWNGMISLQGVETLWLAFCTSDNAGIRRDFTAEQHLVLEMLSEAMPAVRRLGFVSHSVPLDFLRNFRNLQSLSVDPKSQSTPSQTLDIVRSLKHLEELEFPAWIGVNRKLTLDRDPYPLEMESFTREFSQKMQPLRFLGLPFPFIHEFEMPLLHAHYASLRQLNLYFSGCRSHLNEEVEVNFFRQNARLFSSMWRLESINFYSEDVDHWRDMTLIPFRPISVRNDLPPNWVLARGFQISEIRQLAKM